MCQHLHVTVGETQTQNSTSSININLYILFPPKLQMFRTTLNKPFKNWNSSTLVIKKSCIALPFRKSNFLKEYSRAAPPLSSLPLFNHNQTCVPHCLTASHFLKSLLDLWVALDTTLHPFLPENFFLLSSLFDYSSFYVLLKPTPFQQSYYYSQVLRTRIFQLSFDYSYTASFITSSCFFPFLPPS